ncbi:MAG TPA: tail fiber domain-containing protein [Verrucomicrobiae bacterium]|jgi:hypothetical protein|nr:tail fiber domain-containing protein [Verrucomicrobiae bacterium]
MPRNPGTGIYTKPYPDVISDTTIESTVHNGEIADIETDLNTPRPIVAGGTGANNATTARDNLDAERAGAQVTNYDTHNWESGSFWSADGATGAPSVGYYFGICYILNDNNTVAVHARQIGSPSPGPVWVRIKHLGTWGAWTHEFVTTTGGTMSGNLTINNANPALTLSKTSVTTGGNSVYGFLNSIPRWGMFLGYTDAETGLNVGSSFVVRRYDDVGNVYPTDPIKISRQTGEIKLNSSVPNMSWRVLDVNGKMTLMSANDALSDHSPGYIDANPLVFNSNSGGLARFSGMVVVDNATASTGSSNGALSVAGGIGVTGASAFGNYLAVGTTPGATPGLGNMVTGISMYPDGAILCSRTGPVCGYFNINSAGILMGWYLAGNNVGSIAISGAGTAYNTTSDARLKEDLKSFDAGNIIDDTMVYDFKWKDLDERGYGVIAQQAKDVYATPTFYDKEADRWFIDYSKYVPVLLQELKALRARVTELEGKVSAGMQPP